MFCSGAASLCFNNLLQMPGLNEALCRSGSDITGWWMKRGCLLYTLVLQVFTWCLLSYFFSEININQKGQKRKKRLESWLNCATEGTILRTCWILAVHCSFNCCIICHHLLPPLIFLLPFTLCSIFNPWVTDSSP